MFFKGRVLDSQDERTPRQQQHLKQQRKQPPAERIYLRYSDAIRGCLPAIVQSELPAGGYGQHKD